MARGVIRRKRLADQVRQQGMDITQHREIFRILQASDARYTKNSNGLFVDLTEVDDATVAKIESFVSFCADSSRLLERQRYALPTGEASAPAGNAPVSAPNPAAEAASDAVSGEVVSKALEARHESISQRRKAHMRYSLMRKRFSRPAPIAPVPRDSLLTPEA
jgi:hypothetical protein